MKELARLLMFLAALVIVWIALETALPGGMFHK